MEVLELECDDREPDSIFQKLREMGIPVKKKRLKFCDYVFGDFAIERKSSHDFCTSIQNNRIFKQLYELQKAYPEGKLLLIIIGELPVKVRWERFGRRRVPVSLTENERDKKEITMLSGIATILNSYHNIRIINLPLQRQFPRLLFRLYLRQKKKESLRPVRKKKSDEPDKIKWDMLSMLPGVGSKGASIISKSNISILELAQMKPEEIAKKYKGIGIKRATIMVEVLNLK